MLQSPWCVLESTCISATTLPHVTIALTGRPFQLLSKLHEPSHHRIAAKGSHRYRQGEDSGVGPGLAICRCTEGAQHGETQSSHSEHCFISIAKSVMFHHSPQLPPAMPWARSCVAK